MVPPPPSQALRSLRDVLLAEEQRVESGAARESMAKAGVTLKQRVKGDQDAEASIVGGVIQVRSGLGVPEGCRCLCQLRGPLRSIHSWETLFPCCFSTCRGPEFSPHLF